MADKHPYTAARGGLTQIINHLRQSFPPVVNAETLKKLEIAPNNESYILNILRFIGVLDDEGKKLPAASPIFAKHDDVEFQKGLSELLQKAYSGLFELHGDRTWQLEDGKLISYFRGADETSGVVGKRQAATFQTLAALAGHREPPVTKTAQPKAVKSARVHTANATTGKSLPTKTQAAAAQTSPTPATVSNANGGAVGLTVRIEINLPAAGDQDTYDRIFKSIRENLLSVH